MKMEKEDSGLEFLQKLKQRFEANDKRSIQTDLTQTEISFIRKLSPARYEEEPYELYKWRQKLKKKVDKYVGFLPNEVDKKGNAIPRRKEKK